LFTNKLDPRQYGVIKANSPMPLTTKAKPRPSRFQAIYSIGENSNHVILTYKNLLFKTKISQNRNVTIQPLD
jgi:hypothetical protein